MTFKSQLREASKTVSVDLSTVYHDVVTSTADPDAYMALPYEDAKHLMARSRATLFPKGLNTAEEITEYLELNRDNPDCPFSKNYFKTVNVTVEGKKEYAIMLKNDELLSHVDTEVTSYLFDATFKTCPRNFYQVFNLAADIAGHTTLLVCAVMTRKTFGLYLKVLRAIKSAYPQIFPKQASSDYESAIARSVYQVWPQCDLSGCMLHFMGALNKKMRLPGKLFF
jgi:hypothetical protein